MLNINILKNKVETNNFSEGIFFVLQLTDESSKFIVKQYIDLIAKNNNLEIEYIKNLKDIPESTGFVEDSNLYVFECDKTDVITPHNNLIIICNKTDYSEVIKIPKLEHWQFVDYLCAKVPGMNKSDLEWLITQYEVTDSRVTTTNYFRLDNDLDKISIFEPEQQDTVFNQLYQDGEYNTISNLTIFDLTNALVKKDVNGVLQVLKVFDYIDSKPHIWLLSILLGSIRNIIGIQIGINTTPESLGISDKQYYVVKKYNCGYYNTEQLINIYEMLTEIEYKYKFGGLTQEQLADYIICKVLAM